MENTNFKFRNWTIYKDARAFRKEINELLKAYPKEEKFALVDQTKRALDSILLNIAEGAAKNSDKDTRVYINRSQGSLNEVVSCLDCAMDDSYITKQKYEELLRTADTLARQLNRFNLYLKNSSVVKD